MSSQPQTISDAHRALVNGEVSAVDLADAYLSAIDEQNEALNAFIEVFDDVRGQAAAADERLRAGESVTPLTGIPIAVKDNLLVEGRKATAASKILEGYVAPYTATAVAKLREAGAVLVGRTNLDEFAMGSSTEHSCFGPTKNPHDLSRVPGGSSGGSAAAVAASLALAALGSDTGGSIRQPASFCGVVGLKPTYGSVSRSGLIAFGSSLDVVGPLTRTVSDAELVFNVIRGHDALDSTTVSDVEANVDIPKKMKIGVPRAFLSDSIDPDVRTAFDAALKRLGAAGHEVIDVDLPYLKHALPAYYVINPAEASSNLARYDGVKFGLREEGADRIGDTRRTRGVGFGAEVRRRILVGTYVLSAGYYDAYYGRALDVRTLIRRDFQTAFESVDAIATPTTPTPAFLLGEKSDPLSMYLADVFTVPANLAGVPAISVPMGAVSRGDSRLPVGCQFVASHRREDILFALGSVLES